MTLTLGEKLDQRRFSHMTPKMAAIVSYILGDEATMKTTPEITGMVITSDGIVLAQHTGHVGANVIIGDEQDLVSNLANLIIAADLTVDETLHVNALYHQRVRKA